ncbi:MAG: zinc-binding dehydrogenase [Acidobacteriaceae bacterium]
MKAVRFHEFGGPEVLRYEEAPDPHLRNDQVLVRVRACALNHLDLWIRKGLPGVKLPHISGADVAGEVADVGEYVSDLNVGQRVLLAPMSFCGRCEFCVRGEQSHCRQFTVLGYANDGGNAEYIAVPRVNVVAIPDTMGFAQAASAPLVFVTAWHMLVARAKIRAGSRVLVLGGGSGVGTAAIQIAKMLGAEVIATAGDQQKLARCQELGADHVIDQYKQRISEEVRRITHKEGVDIVFEHVGQATFAESIKSLRYGGTLVTCGATTGADAQLDIRVLFARQLSLLGSYMGTMGDFHEVMKHIFAGRLKPVLDRSYPLSDATSAHEYLESGKQFGKVVLLPGEDHGA